MVLGTAELLKLVKEIGLLENLSDRELNNPEGAGFDLRIEKLYRIRGSGELMLETRKTAEHELIAEHGMIELEPLKAYMMETVEKVNMPDYLLAEIKPRSTLYRSGVLLRSGFVSPGYRGKLFFMLVNFSDSPFRIELGSRIAHIVFHRVEGKLVRKYEGQWQGGRKGVYEKEKQI